MNSEKRLEKEQRWLKYLQEKPVKGILYYGVLKVESWYEIAKKAKKNRNWRVCCLASFMCCLAPIAVPTYAVWWVLNKF